jgi:hypothetical protein
MHSRLMAWSSVLFAGSAVACLVASSACNSSSGTTPLGDDGSNADDSGTGSSSGTSSSSGASSGSSNHDAGSSSGGTTDASANSPTVLDCGGSCNLTTNTCCLASDMTGHCVTHGTACGTSGGLPEAEFDCLGASDCPSGQVCCGIADENQLEAKTVCMATCPTMSSSSTQGQVQLCKGNAECQNKMDCIAQTCLANSNFNLCGLTSQAPYSCKAR